MQIFYSALVAALTMAGMADAKPATPMVIKESVSAPSHWVRRGPAPDSHVINMQFGLKQQAMGSLLSKLDDISHPDSPNYGKWLSHEEVHAYTAPSQDSIQAVKMWLEAHGIQEKVEKRSVSGDWMTADVTVAQARTLLGEADFAVWQHRATGEQLIRTTEYSVPRSVADHIDLIGPTTYFSEIRALNKQGQQSSKLNFKPLTKEHLDFVKGSASQDVVKPLEKGVPASSVTPASTDANYPTVNGVPTSCNILVVTYDCLRQFYKTFNYKVAHPKQQRIGVSGFLSQFASYSDLKTFFQTQRPPAYSSGYNFTTVLVNPSAMNDQAMPGDEANLDVQAVGAVAYPLPYTFYSNGGSPPFQADEATPTNTNEPYSTEFTYLLALPDKQLPSILTTSYGDDEQTVPLSYATRVCNEIATLGARGTTVFFSSGDSGVGVDGDCVSNDGKNTPRFLPAFPASCPFVTAVGATEQFSPEQASGPTAGYYGGGGFSNYFPMPAYQKTVVQAYVKSLGTMYKGLYNASGRAYPDVSAQGSEFVTVNNGTYGTVSGTSAACPLTASIFALINDKRISAGQAKLGFINPLLYQKGTKGLNDITIGSNKGCNTNGFPAKAGWDAATGFGTPDFDKLTSIFVA